MADIKKKFIDILFDDDDEDKPEVESKPKTLDEAAKDNVGVRAKDILYRRAGGSAFIDLEEKPKQSSESDTQDKHDDNNPNDYEFSSQISPIFGIIKENKRNRGNISPEITDTQINKPIDSHLDIITSPIYGYGNKEDAIKNNYDIKAIGENTEEQQLHELFDEEEYASAPFDNNSSDEGLLEEDILNEDISLFRLFGDSK